MEYEYSFKVNDIKPYINYCKENGSINIVLDFKDDNDSDEVLKVSRETIPIVINDDNKEAIMSMLDIFGYKIKKELIRKRYVYKKEDTIFEIDDYTSPEIMHVIAIEGKKEQVDKVYNEVKEIN